MKIIQVLSNVGFGDAIGNHTCLLKKHLEEMGFETGIYAECWDKRHQPGIISPFAQMPHLDPDDVVIFHVADGTWMNMLPFKWNCRKIMFWHNITPPRFIRPFDMLIANALQSGLDDVALLNNSADRYIAGSQFSKNDLLEMNYPEDRITVMPSYYIPFEDYSKAPDIEIMKKYSDGWLNLLFVGRIAPNKKHEDIIRAFAYYKKYINPKSRLILVGSVFLKDYNESLRKYITELGVKDVIWAGHISFSQLIALYKISDIFLCCSEHEGFCVPLAEAMFFQLPIIAYNSSAVPETLGGSSIVLDTKDPAVWAKTIDLIAKDHALRREIIERQNNRLKDLSLERTKAWFENYLYDFLCSDESAVSPTDLTALKIYQITHRNFVAAHTGEKDITVNKILSLTAGDSYTVSKYRNADNYNFKDRVNHVKIYIDITNVLTSHITGIPRVSMEVVKRLLVAGHDITLLTSNTKSQQFDMISNEFFLSSLKSVPLKPSEMKITGTVDINDFEPGSAFLDINNTWHMLPNRGDFLPQLKNRGVHIVLFIQDIIPISHPQFLKPDVRAKFLSWLSAHVKYDEIIVCNSEFTKAELLSLFKQLNITAPEIRVAHLGCDFKPYESELIEKSAELAAAKGKYILAVGTVEPRKNIELLLDAYDMYLCNEDVNIILAGRGGWSKPLLSRIHGHKKYGSRIFHLEHLDDASIKYLYNNAHIVAFPSRIEGFGLPTVEALVSGVPVMLSDIPIFHEVAGDSGVYFDPDSPKDFYEKYRKLNTPEEYAKYKALAKSYKPWSWDDCASKIEGAILDVISATETLPNTPITQIVYLSARKEAVLNTLPFVERYMGFIKEVVICCQHDTAEIVKNEYAGKLKLVIIEDDELLDGDSLPRDHSTRNFFLRCRMMRNPKINEEFIMSDDDYRPLVNVDESFFKQDGRYKAYYMADLGVWSDTIGKQFSYDKCMFHTLAFLRNKGFSQMMFASHMPQVINKRLYCEMTDNFSGIEFMGLDEWSSYFNYLRARHGSIIDFKRYVTLQWPEGYVHCPLTPLKTEYVFENFYDFSYTKKGAFNFGLPQNITENIDSVNASKIEKKKEIDNLWRRSMAVWKSYEEKYRAKHGSPPEIAIEILGDTVKRFIVPDEIELARDCYSRIRFKLKRLDNQYRPLPVSVEIKQGSRVIHKERMNCNPDVNNCFCWCDFHHIKMLGELCTLTLEQGKVKKSISLRLK